MNSKTIVGIITITAIVGGSAYCIKKYLDAKKSEGEITLAEARMEVEARKSTMKVAKDFGMTDEEVEEIINPEVEQSYDFYADIPWTTPFSETITEEDKELRFERNSIQARDQFIKMELAELVPSSRDYQKMKRLYDFPFTPTNSGDEALYSKIRDYRAEFFGDDSVWIDIITMADVITHFARLTDYNVGGGVATWIDRFLYTAGFDETQSSMHFEIIIEKLNAHEFQNEELTQENYTLFGVNNDDMINAWRWVEDSMTYEIEFNTFLQSNVNGL